MPPPYQRMVAPMPVAVPLQIVSPGRLYERAPVPDAMARLR